MIDLSPIIEEVKAGVARLERAIRAMEELQDLRQAKEQSRENLEVDKFNYRPISIVHRHLFAGCLSGIQGRLVCMECEFPADDPIHALDAPDSSTDSRESPDLCRREKEEN